MNWFSQKVAKVPLLSWLPVCGCTDVHTCTPMHMSLMIFFYWTETKLLTIYYRLFLFAFCCSPLWNALFSECLSKNKKNKDEENVSTIKFCVPENENVVIRSNCKNMPADKTVQVCTPPCIMLGGTWCNLSHFWWC
jgi:hypothetical protein